MSGCLTTCRFSFTHARADPSDLLHQTSQPSSSLLKSLRAGQNETAWAVRRWEKCLDFLDSFPTCPTATDSQNLDQYLASEHHQWRTRAHPKLMRLIRDSTNTIEFEYSEPRSFDLVSHIFFGVRDMFIMQLIHRYQQTFWHVISPQDKYHTKPMNTQCIGVQS